MCDRLLELINFQVRTHPSLKLVLAHLLTFLIGTIKIYLIQ
jgi:hypothetical protein